MIELPRATKLVTGWPPWEGAYLSGPEARQGGVALNSAGVSLLLARFLDTTDVKGAAGQSGDGQFSWIAGDFQDVDQETLCELLAGVMADADEMPWDEIQPSLRRTTFDFDSEQLVIYLVRDDFVVAAVASLEADVSNLDRAMGDLVSDLRQFV
jgi:hypothetical protein